MTIVAIQIWQENEDVKLKFYESIQITCKASDYQYFDSQNTYSLFGK